MSRIAKAPIKLPSGVQASVSPDMVVTLKGPKGQSVVDTKKHVKVRQEDGGLVVERHGDESEQRAFHGLYHRLLTSAIEGVTKGYTKALELQGVGYKAEVKGKIVVINCGYSHEVKHKPNPAVTITTPAPTQIVITGSDKQIVGQEAAKLRSYAPPEPYKGKGIRYLGENVRRKVGKSGAK